MLAHTDLTVDLCRSEQRRANRNDAKVNVLHAFHAQKNTVSLLFKVEKQVKKCNVSKA